MLEFEGVVSVLSVLFGAVAAFAWAWTDRAFRRQRGDGSIAPSEFRKKRIERLTGALQDADQLLGEIDAEIRLGHQRAEELDAEVKRLEALADLTNEQSEGVKSLLSEMLDSNRKRSLLQQFLMNFGFFVGGVVVTVIAATIVSSP